VKARTDGDAWLMHAEKLLQRRHIAFAAAAFDHAELLGADPDQCSAGRWLLAMLSGKFESAWREGDAIRRRGTPDANRFWQGEDISGKRVIVRCLHGLGDAIQFLRYAPLLRNRTGRLIVQVPPRFVELAVYLDGVDEVITWGGGGGGPEPDWDVQIEVIELPYLFRTVQDDLPVATNYLKLPREVLDNAYAKPDLPGNFQVGLVWAGGEWNTSRSVPLELMTPLLQTGGCEFWNLQGMPARADWVRFSDFDGCHSAEHCADSVLGLAGLIAQLDLVITTDTLAAHLAGALGTPAWVMLEYAADWRWMHGREDCPWYPSVRLFRQKARGNWHSVVQQLRANLEDLTAARCEGRLVA
jgi:hypothetical protein